MKSLGLNMPNDLNKNSNSTAFSNPVDEKTKIELLKLIATSKTNVTVYSDQKSFEAVTYPSNDFNRITVPCAKGSSIDSFRASQSLVCHFSLHEENYFFTSKTTLTDTALIFSTPTVVYKVQRRDNFRVDIPQNFPHQIEITGLKELKIKLLDLSMGGCKINATYSEPTQISQLKENFEIALKFSFLSFENLTVYAKIKFTKHEPRTKSVAIGLEFEKLKADEIQDLQANIFKIERLKRQSRDD